MDRDSRQKVAVAVVVDSAASLPSGAAEYDHLHVVPMLLTVGGRTYQDGLDLATVDFYRMLREMKTSPTTSAPTPAGFLAAFRRACNEVSSILCLTVSQRFSSSYTSAGAAALELKEERPDVRIDIVDSMSAAGGEGLVAMEAWRAATEGAGLESVAAAANAAISRVSLIAYLDTLYHVWKSGRVPGIAYAGTSLLQVKPVFELSRGEVRTIARPRSAKKAARCLVELMSQRVGSSPVHATVMHADAYEAAERVHMAISSGFQLDELFISEFSPVMGAHTGPGLLGIAFWTEEPGA